MATIAARSAYAATAAYPGSTAAPPSASPFRVPPSAGTNAHHVFTSPTESEFSESYKDARDSVLDWDETRVADWLRSINLGQYVDLFRKNNINGENLMEIDQPTLKEMGIKKIGDRVRIGTQAKVFRSSVYKRTSKRISNRHSLALLDANRHATPPSSNGSPRPLHSTRAVNASRPENDKLARSNNAGDGGYVPQSGGRSSSRPPSPLIDQENRRMQRHHVPTPMDIGRRDHTAPYPSQPAPASAGYGRRAPGETPQTARFAGHVKASPSFDHSSSGALPSDKQFIRVVYETGSYKVIDVDGARTAEDIVRATLRKGGLPLNHSRSYCFYVLDGTDPNPTFCRRLGEAELIKLCNDRVRSERGRFILRKIHAGEPEGEQLRTAARIAEQQKPEPPAIEVQSVAKNKSQLKLEKLTGEPLAAVSYPMSPATQAEKRDYFDAEMSISRNASQVSTASARARKLKDFYGARPPTELITQDLRSYFPDVNKEEMDRTVRMSIRRSRRMSKAISRLSTASTFSVASSLKDAPPIPTIADHWAKEAGKHVPGPRPLSVVNMGRPASIASTVLDTLEEEESPDRKSYVSFSGAEDGSDTATSTSNLAGMDPERASLGGSYFDDNNASPAGTEGGGSSSLNSRLSQFIAEDGEEEDEELMQHLEKDSWDDLKYMKGAMIGQGSFGTVFLALHAVTAELMAVKQVEMPSSNGTAMDAKKNNMIEALKHEISLLRDLQHPNIVRYLGSNSDETHLNIFLEYVAGGSVATMLVNYGSLPEGLISNFVRQILQGLNFLHSRDIIHRDIKGANILVDNKGSVKISDFGISKRVEASTLLHPQASGPKRGAPRVSLQGSVFWMAPEVVRQTAYTKKADIWSLGCLIVEMFTGSHPHPTLTQLQAIFKIGGSGPNADNARPDLPDVASEDAKQFLRRTFEIEHEKRPSAEELMGYAFCTAKT
nr:protein kinase byr2 [Quercus suber]